VLGEREHKSFDVRTEGGVQRRFADLVQNVRQLVPERKRDVGHLHTRTPYTRRTHCPSTRAVFTGRKHGCRFGHVNVGRVHGCSVHTTRLHGP